MIRLKHAFSRRFERFAPRSEQHGPKRGESGFSLTELLAVMVIMLLVGSVVATCIPAAHSAYVKTTDVSNAQVLLSTTASRLRDVLSVAEPNNPAPIDDATDYLVEFKSKETGYVVRIKNVSINTDGKKLNGLAIRETNPMTTENPSDTDYVSLVPGEMAKAKGKNGEDMYVKADDIDYDHDNGVFTVTNLKVYRGTGATEVGIDNAKIDSLKVKVLAAV